MIVVHLTDWDGFKTIFLEEKLCTYPRMIKYIEIIETNLFKDTQLKIEIEIYS